MKVKRACRASSEHPLRESYVFLRHLRARELVMVLKKAMIAHASSDGHVLEE